VQNSQKTPHENRFYKHGEKPRGGVGSGFKQKNEYQQVSKKKKKTNAKVREGVHNSTGKVEIKSQRTEKTY